MNNLNKAVVIAGLGAALFLTACGSGGGGGDAPAAVVTTEVPLSAQQSSLGLIDYLKLVIATMTNETSEPILVGDAVFPTDETGEPININ